MSGHRSLIDELEQALPSRTTADRAHALRRVTDLLMFSSSTYAAEELAVFDDVMLRLVAELEASMRAELSRRLATIPHVPPRMIRLLATDAHIDVAAPVLRASPSLDDATLAEAATTASQAHLLAIAERATLATSVTDELLRHGDRDVALRVAGNQGAQLSEEGHGVLVERSKEDGELAACVFSRPDIPHRQLLKLLTVASGNVRRMLEALDPQRTNLIRQAIAEVSNDLQNRLRVQSRDYTAVHRIVAGMQEAGELDGARVEAFAAKGDFEAVTLALAILSDLPIGACERAMVQDRSELILLLAKAIGFSWETTKMLLRLRAEATGTVGHGFDDEIKTFSRLRHETARKAIAFVRMHERAAMYR
jgi:uncharacterized protein (DUF2336 family)